MSGKATAEETDAAFEGLAWRKSRHSNPNGSCVELAPLGDGRIAMRHSKHVDGPKLIYTVDEVAAFIAGAKDGEFDDLLG